ncbi:LacI family DNA-binding transcriptional regulator [Chryseolinea sp. T2]|uniref:LacI family DNA-binding transcriptional regulator n=1 Tax=Chryseolinea sp. T2 TaxID=3129255 RepID=UPI0030781F38
MATNHKVSIVDIAEKAGVSITTVSRVLNGKGEEYRISEKAQQKIRETARKLNYVPNQFAASLKSGKTNTIALIIPSLSNPFFADIASEINVEVRNRGYATIIGDSDEKIDIENEELRQMVSRNIEGLIIVPCTQDWASIKKMYDQGRPIVCIDRYFEDADIPYVSTDNYEGAVMATRHLIDNGHKHIACIQGVHESVPNKLRIQGYKDAMIAAGLNKYVIVGDEFSIRNGYKETKLLLQSKQRPTALFTLSNTIAMGSMKALREDNVSIPDDMSLVTFDDHPYLEYLSTPLTCVTQPTREICQLAVKHLFFMLGNKEIKSKQVLLRPELTYRKSVKKL